jgi:hypothetical protein
MRTRVLVALLAAFVLAGATGWAQVPVASRLLSVPDLDGREVFPFEPDGARGYALVFVRPGCPVSNRAAPEVARLYDEFARQGIVLSLVYPGRQPRDDIREHAEAFGYPMPPLRDPGMRLVDLAGVTITPEAAVFDASRRLVYRGRLDDRYLDLGRARREPTVRDAYEVLSALVTGRPVPWASRPAVGCFIDDLR